MTEFKKYHPLINLIYFIFVIGFSMFFLNPVCLLISFFASVFYSFVLNGKRNIKFFLLFLLPMAVLTMLINPIFNHEGVTVLAYLPNGNPLTMESFVYGFAAGIMLISVISWFSCFNSILTSDKVIYLFGRMLPSVSLILSMVLSFVPRFRERAKQIYYARCGLNLNASKGFQGKIKELMAISSVMVSWSLENSIETADSLKSRGYGLGSRTAFSNYRFSKHDILMLVSVLILGIIIIWNAFNKTFSFTYFPIINNVNVVPKNLFAYLSYFLLCSLPLNIEIWEVLKWKRLKSKI
ncbi:MAG: energy-coupling factor transporter transmembrane protein EcfT [Clostridia bacterium]|nr:energy-coupling factor transporter transmembrane protein EcfT [Clostridia bacterium]